jgi:8-hydroxy-5-deazaflavin:NADPH oxidoreductase
MAGKTLLDATNVRTGTGDLVYPNSSLGEHLQAALPAVHVVKSLNTAAIEVLADPSLVGPATVFVSGDDEAAKTEVKGLLHDLGWKDEGIIDPAGTPRTTSPRTTTTRSGTSCGTATTTG